MGKYNFANQQTGRQLQGYKVVMANLRKEMAKIQRRSVKGLLKAAILIRRDMDTTPPLIPVDLGNLRASSFIIAGNGQSRTAGSFSGPDSARMNADHSSVIAKERGKVTGKLSVAIGFSAHYAGIVEADTTTKRKRSGAGGGFFEMALQRNAPLILEVIKKER